MLRAYRVVDNIILEFKILEFFAEESHDKCRSSLINFLEYYGQQINVPENKRR